MIPTENEVKNFISLMQDSIDTQQVLFMFMEFPIKWMGLKIIQCLNGSKFDSVKKLKEISDLWFDRYINESSNQSDVHYAHHLHKEVDLQSLRKDRASADLGMCVFAGTHGPSTIIEQALMHCARHLDIQMEINTQLRNEFMDPDTMNVRLLKKKVPLLIALVWESLRLSETTRLSLTRVLHESLETDDGFHLPKSSVIFLNIYALNRDARQWGDNALQFDPLRFLNNDGCLDWEKRGYLANFGFAKRNCPGYDLAEHNITLVLAHFIWKYKVEAPFGNPKETLPLLTESDFNRIESPLPLRYTLIDQ